DTPLKGLLDTFSRKDSRIKVVQNHKRLRISDNTNAGLMKAEGDWIVFADHDDLLTQDALYEVAREIHAFPETEFIYSDEDKYLPGDIPGEPNFKPDFSPDFLTSVNYICHLVAVKRELLERTGMLNPEYDGAQDYDFVLRCTEHTRAVRHIPKVLYHWRWTENSTAADPKAKDYAFTAGARAVKAHLDRMGIKASVTGGIHAGTYTVREEIEGEPLISVIIPNKDHIDDLTRAVGSVNEKSTYRNLEFIIVENNSTEDETWAGYDALTGKYSNVRIVRYEGAFNYSAINNLGVTFARGTYLLFLNNDTEIIAGDSIRNMLGVCQRADVGAVGARLYFEDGTIQHAGVVLGYGGIAGHAFREFGAEEAGYQNRILLRQNVSAVTAACMLVKRKLFEDIGGFCEELAVAFNDIDLCMKITAAGRYVVYEPGAEFYHYESKSRGYEDTPERQARFMNEVRVFKERWKKELDAGDPYYNPNLTLERPDFTLK
ncbi:MAG: glycosyltransferase family 2 protein, partial [Lachnospiraceae bacterium]|nr:glycosyltransferase family 2 protein [Lachnospiraceae bacterium]